MVGSFSLSPPCSCTKIGKLPTAEFAKQMLQMPGVVSSLPPLEADAFHMAKTDDNFHLKCPLDLLVATIRGLRWPRGGRPIPIDLVQSQPWSIRGTSIELLMRVRWPIDSRPLRIPYVLRPLVAVLTGNSKTLRSLLLAVCSSTISEPSGYILLKFLSFSVTIFLRARNYSTAKEIAKCRTPRWLIRTVVFRIRSLPVSWNWTWQSGVESSAR
jgi:hypothetical protein